MHPLAKKLAFRDIYEGLAKWRLWMLLAYQDIKLRYRRSFLGPLWITLSMGITIYSMGYLYSHLLHTPLDTYFPYLTTGMIAWGLISSTIAELTETFVNSEGLLKQIKLPYSLYVHRVAARNLLIFFHNILVYVPILLIYHSFVKLNAYTFLIFPALFIFYINAFIFGTILGMLGARYRDLSPIVKSLIQVVFFITPIMWHQDILPKDKQIIVLLNPVNSFLDLLRAPLLGQLPSTYNLLMVFCVTFLGILILYKLFIRYRSRIIYWL